MPLKSTRGSQASDGFAITPSDTLSIAADAANTKLYTFCYVHVAGASGTVSVVLADGATVSLYGAQGAVLGGNMPVIVRQVRATGTTAASLVALISKGS